MATNTVLCAWARAAGVRLPRDVRGLVVAFGAGFADRHCAQPDTDTDATSSEDDTIASTWGHKLRAAAARVRLVIMPDGRVEFLEPEA